MIVYKDVFTGDEMLSDAMKNTRDEEDGLILACDSYKIGKGGEVFAFENNDEVEGYAGGERNTEEARERVDESVEMVNNVVETFQLVETGMDKKMFQGMIKIYLKKVKAYLEKEKPERVQPFMDGMKAWVPKFLKNFDEYQLYIGEATNPVFYIIKDGLSEEKF